MQSRLLPPLTELSVALTSLTVGPVAVCSTLRLSLLQPFIVLAEGLMMMLIKDAEDLCLPSPPLPTPLPSPPPYTSTLLLSCCSFISPHPASICHLCLSSPLTNLFIHTSVIHLLEEVVSSLRRLGVRGGGGGGGGSH